ncbi:MAG: hypothetical protein NT129_06145 [Candidatus Aenigmarchaeota archaeon]|nr:hypothetical protein [Candidatus Aenigmarchaeota archaeon]
MTDENDAAHWLHNYNLKVVASPVHGGYELNPEIITLGGGIFNAKNYERACCLKHIYPRSLVETRTFTTDALTADEFGPAVRKFLEAKAKMEIAPIHLIVAERDFGFF